MFKWLGILIRTLVSAARTRQGLVTENLALRQQLAVLKHRHPRPRLTAADRLFWVLLATIWSGWRGALHIVQPETVIRWHREGFRYYWRWKSRGRGRPKIDAEIRRLIRRMSRANPLWGAPRIHGELLKLGVDVSEATVSKYMIKRRGPPSQTWRTFLDNHAKELIALDFFTVPTATFKVLFVLVVLRHDRRRILHFNVTEHPTAGWTARRRDISSAIATRSMVRTSADRQMRYGSRKFVRLLDALGRTRMRSASSARFAANVWTT